MVEVDYFAKFERASPLTFGSVREACSEVKVVGWGNRVAEVCPRVLEQFMFIVKDFAFTEHRCASGEISGEVSRVKLSLS